MNFFKSIFRRKPPAILSVERFFPQGHPRAGQATHFASRMFSVRDPKIHALRRDCGYWAELSQAKGTPLRIVYNRYDNLSGVQLPVTLIAKIKSTHVQPVVIPETQDEFMLVQGKPVAVAEFARNEGLSLQDFRDLYCPYAGLQAAVVHFTGFRY